MGDARFWGIIDIESLRINDADALAASERLTAMVGRPICGGIEAVRRTRCSVATLH